MKTSKKNVAKNNTRKRLNYIGGGNNSIYKSRKNRRHINSNNSKKLLNKTVKVFKYRSKYKTKYAASRYNGRGGGSFLGKIARYFDTDTDFLSMNRKRFENFVEDFEEFKGNVTKKMEGLEVEGVRIKKAADDEALILTDRLTNKKYNTVLNIALNDNTRFSELEGEYYDSKNYMKSALRQKFDMEMKITNAKDIDLNNRVNIIKKKVKDAQPELKDFKKQLNEIEQSLDDITKEYAKLSKYRTRIEQIRNDYNEFSKTEKKNLTKKQLKIVKKYVNNKGEYDKILAFSDVTLNTIAELTNKRANLQHTLEYYTKQSENLEYAKSSDPINSWSDTAQNFYDTLKELIEDTGKVIKKIDDIYTYADKIWRQMESSVRQEVRDKRVKFNELRGELRNFKEIFDMARKTFQQIDIEFLSITPASRIAIDVAEISRACALVYSGLYRWYKEISDIDKALYNVQSQTGGGIHYSDGGDIGIPVSDYKYLTQIYKQIGGDGNNDILAYYAKYGNDLKKTLSTTTQPAPPAPGATTAQTPAQTPVVISNMEAVINRIVNDFIVVSDYKKFIDSSKTSPIKIALTNIITKCYNYDTLFEELDKVATNINQNKDDISQLVYNINSDLQKLKNKILTICSDKNINTTNLDQLKNYINTDINNASKVLNANNDIKTYLDKISHIMETMGDIIKELNSLESSIKNIQSDSTYSDSQRRAALEFQQNLQRQAGTTHDKSALGEQTSPTGRQTAIDKEVIDNTKACSEALANIISASNPDKSILKNFISKIVSLDKMILSMREIERKIHSFSIKKDNAYSPNISWLTGELKKELKDEQLHLDSTKKMIEIAKSVEKYNDPNTPYLKYLKNMPESSSSDMYDFFDHWNAFDKPGNSIKDKLQLFFKEKSKDKPQFEGLWKKLCTNSESIIELYEANKMRKDKYNSPGVTQLSNLLELIVLENSSSVISKTPEQMNIIKTVEDLANTLKQEFKEVDVEKIMGRKSEKKKDDSGKKKEDKNKKEKEKEKEKEKDKQQGNKQQQGNKKGKKKRD